MSEWNPKANDIFVRAAEIDIPADRKLFVEQQCHGDADLLAQVHSLLAAGGQIGSFLERPAIAFPDAAQQTGLYQPITEGPGSIIGPYKLLQHIGEGGFGAVYMAEQEKPVRRKVALKIIKPGMDTREVIARFESERQALAMMDHPNIARVFDAGATENGRPYFVMELVRGIPITEFCDKNKFSTEQRLKLFIAVCHAVQHAHHKGIIHRDIKPSNVMITLHDGVPVVKVIDFGVAKATAQKLTERTLFTAYGQMIGTPAYMSPEQAEMSGLDIDTRSDIFSLGVLLYELLTGTTPLDGKQLRKAGYIEMQRLIREEEAPRPSTRFSSMGDEATVLANNRSTDIKRLSHDLRGDLDWIVMKSLEKDRNRRYGSPANFAADVERFLTEQPVEACPPTFGYRLRKSYRRNRAVLTMMSVIAAVLLLGTGISLWQAVAAGRAKAVAIAERDDKEKALFAEAEQRELAEKAATETKAANQKLQQAYDQQRADQYAWDIRSLPLVWESGNVSETKRLLARQPEMLRNFEWHYWDRKTNPEVFNANLLTDRGGARFGDMWIYSGDGRRLALSRFPTHLGFGESKEFDKSQESTLTVWDLTTQKVIFSHRFADTRQRHAPVTLDRSQFSHDGKRILFVRGLTSLDRKNGIKLIGAQVDVFDIERNETIFSQKFEKEPQFLVQTNLQLTRDGRRLLASLSTREIPKVAWLNGKIVDSEIQIFELNAKEKKPQIIPDAVLRAVNPEGSRLVFTKPAMDDSVRFAVWEGIRQHTVWNVETGKEVRQIDLLGQQLVFQGNELYSVVLADGQKSDRCLLKSWNAETGKERLSVPLPFGARLNGGPSAGGKQIGPQIGITASMVFNRDGTKLLVYNGTNVFGQIIDGIAMIDPATGKIPATVNYTAKSTYRMPNFGAQYSQLKPFYTADGDQVVVLDGNVIRTFDAKNGQPLQTLRGHENDIFTCGEGLDGRLWSIEAAGVLKQWNLKPAEPKQIITRSTDEISFSILSFDVDKSGDRIAVFGSETTDKPGILNMVVQVMDTEGTIVKEIRRPEGNRSSLKSDVSWSDRPRILLSDSSHRVALYLPAIYRKNGDNNATGIPKAEDLLCPPELTVWDVASGKELISTEISFPSNDFYGFSQLRFSADGETVTLAGANKSRNFLRRFDIANRRELPTIDFGESGLDFGDSLISLQYSPDEQRFAAICDRNSGSTLSIHEVATGKHVDLPIKLHESAELIWSPDGTRIAVFNLRDNKTEINLYDSNSGQLIMSLNSSDLRSTNAGFYNRSIKSMMVFNRDGSRIARVIQTTDGGVIRIWDAESGKDLLTIPVPLMMFSHPHLAFSRDNHQLKLIESQLSGGGRNNAFQDHKMGQLRIRSTTFDATPVDNVKK